MKVNYVKLTAGVLTGFMALSSVPYAVYAAGPTAGVASYTSDIVSTSNTLTAGVTSMLSRLNQHMLIQQLHRLATALIYVRVQMKTASLLESSITMELEQYLRQPITDGTKSSPVQ